MWPFRKKGSSAAGAPPPEAAPPPPPPVHFGVPYQPTCLAADPIQATIAVGSSRGEIKLFSRAADEMMLPSASGAAPVAQLAFWTNQGRLLAIQSPGTLVLWDLRRAVRLAAHFAVGAPIDLAWLIPRSPYALLSVEGTVRVYEMEREEPRLSSPWSLDAGRGAPLCAMSTSPAEPRKLLAATCRGELRVFTLGGGAVGLAAHAEGARLTHAAWSSHAPHVLAAYDNGQLLVFSVRNPAAPNAALRVSGAADGPCRGIRRVWVAPPECAEAVCVAGGTAVHEADGVVLLRGAGLRERSLPPPPHGGVREACFGGADELLVLGAAGELRRHALGAPGGAPRPFPPAKYVPREEGATCRVRLALAVAAGGGVSAALAFARALPPPAARVAPPPPRVELHPAEAVDRAVDRSAAARALRLARQAVEENASPFYEEGRGGGGAPAAAPAEEEGLATAASRWLSDGLKWLAKDDAEAEAQPAELLAPLFFPAGGGGEASEEAKRAALLSGGRGGGAGGAPSAAKEVRGRAAGAAAGMHEAVEALHERGDKLNQLGDKTQQLADDADDFLNLAKKLRQKEEKSFFGLF
ncbi:hypothetical protein AB1Y20_010667 [Prymnesium parvum]|uniref:V-SNARE coiled-coil homology domain-containing protein n=1 Tax=Prymnesium parvum TaxID=97485 RepID=A0AB34IRP6_PRYPA